MKMLLFNKRKLLIILLIFTYNFTGSAYSKVIPDSITLYVSTVGNDLSDGLLPEPSSAIANGPFATIQRARNEAKKIRNKHKINTAINILIRSGIYFLKSPLTLDSLDSGSLKYPVIFKAYKNENVIFSGGRLLKNCTSKMPNRIVCNTQNLTFNQLNLFKNNKRMSTNMPPFELFINNRRMPLARWPDYNQQAREINAWAHLTKEADESHQQFFYSGIPQIHSWNLDNAFIHIWPGNDWFDQYIGLKNVNKNRFTLNHATIYPIQSGRRFSILNVPESMNNPGEWYYSKIRQEITFIPPDKKSTNSPVVSYLNNIISVNNAYNIHFQNITFEHSRGSAIKVNGGQNISFRNCVVRNVAGYGVKIHKGKNHSINSSKIYDTGLGGIILKGGNRQILTASGHQASRNIIHHTGRILRSGNAALRLEGVGNIARSNKIYHTPGTAVQITGNNHLLEDNEIYLACKESSDCGAIYTGRDWTFHGNVIRSNLIHDVYGYGMSHIDHDNKIVEYTTPHGARGIYLDDAASGFEVSGNLFYRIPGKMLQIGGGRDNIIRNNLFITSGYAIWMDARWPTFPWEKVMLTRLKAVPYQGRIWKKQFPKLSQPMENPHWPEGNQIINNIILGETHRNKTIIPFKYSIAPESVEINNNIVWNYGNKIKVEYRNLVNSERGIVGWSKWIKSGLDTDSLSIDPHISNNPQANTINKNNSFIPNSRRHFTNLLNRNVDIDKLPPVRKTFKYHLSSDSLR